MSNPVLVAAREKRAAHQSKLDALLEAPTAEKRTLTDDEVKQFEERAEKIAKLDSQIVLLEAEEARAEKATAAAAKLPQGEAVVRREAGVYRQDASIRHGEASYLRDLTVAFVAEARGTDLDHMAGGPDAARERLRRNWTEVQRDADQGERKALASRIVDEVRRWTPEMEQRVNPNTTAGTGGEFVPPLWLVSQYIPYMRPGRVCANRVKNMPLPPGIDVINIPKVTGGTLTAIQTANAAAVASQDATTSSVSASVNTIAGQQDISLQLLEQSPLAMDGVVFDDLSRDYDQRLDLQVLAGSGSGGQHRGVFNTSSINSVTVSSAVFHDSSTSATQYRSLINGVNSIETLRFAPPTAIWVHPRRSNSWAYASDSTNRPLFIPAKYGQFNTVGTNEGAPVVQGVAGELYGLPVVKDANVPTTFLGTATTGGTADAVVVLKEDDLYLWEGTLRMRALPEILSGTLQIRFQVYCYSAFMASRFPTSISVLTGNTGLAAPGF